MKTTFNRNGNDLYWSADYIDKEHSERFSVCAIGYDDENWWKNVAPKQRLVNACGDKGNLKEFVVDYWNNRIGVVNYEI